jgi:hypothetical protein
LFTRLGGQHIELCHLQISKNQINLQTQKIQK